MASKITCDGCDDDITDLKRVTLQAEIVMHGHGYLEISDQQSSSFDVCQKCWLGVRSRLNGPSVFSVGMKEKTK